MDDFEEFFFEHYRRVVGSLTLAVGDGGEVEDAAQEAFARALRRWRSVSEMARPATWVYVVAVRELRRRTRRRAGVTGDGVGAEEQPTLPDHAGGVVTAALIERALGALPPRQRMAVVLRYHGDLSVREVGRVMSCSEGTVKSTLHAALQRLRIELTDEDLEEVNDGR